MRKSDSQSSGKPQGAARGDSSHTERRVIKDAPNTGKISPSQAREAAKYAKTERMTRK
jgi:hypothetical protein